MDVFEYNTGITYNVVQNIFAFLRTWTVTFGQDTNTQLRKE